jgi:hypothetical protein
MVSNVKACERSYREKTEKAENGEKAKCSVYWIISNNEYKRMFMYIYRKKLKKNRVTKLTNYYISKTEKTTFTHPPIIPRG